MVRFLPVLIQIAKGEIDRHPQGGAERNNLRAVCFYWLGVNLRPFGMYAFF